MSCARSSLAIIRARSYGASLGWTQKRCAQVKHGKASGRPSGKSTVWSAGRLATTEEYPLSQRIHAALLPKDGDKKQKTTGRITKKHAGHIRTQIVSPELCDDILNYAGSSLEKYKGCDILDINPGACLWSQKMHDFLQPRSHILLEPEHERFKDFIDPLLKAPKSKYKLVVKDPTRVDSYREIMNEGVFPHQQALDRTTGEGTTVNNTLLVIGSLAWDPRLPGMGFDSMAKQIYHHFTAAAWYDDLFHAFGPVKTLLWVQQDDFAGNIAQGISVMHKANAQLEMTHDTHMIVDAERKTRAVGRASSGREPQYEVESMIRAIRRGEAAGYEIPSKCRQDYTYDMAKHFEKESGDTGIISCTQLHEYAHDQQMKGIVPVGLIPESFIATNEREIELMRTKPEFEPEPFVVGAKRRTGHNTRAYKDKDIGDYWKLRATMINVARVKVKVEAAADIGEQLYLCECKALAASDEMEKQALLKQIDELDQQWDKAVQNVQDNYRMGVFAETDDRLQLRYPPGPRIQWDTRPFEPLTMLEKEVWPQGRLALISTVPKPKPLDADTEWYEWLQDFIWALYRDSSASILVALDGMQHGLSNIVEECPSLRDPKVGGRLLMKHLRVRMLTMDMLKELVTEYRDWPFKSPGSDHNKYFRHKSHSQVMVR